MSSFLAVAAASWGLLMSLSPLLQIRTIRRAGTSQGVSLGYLWVLFVGFALWFCYGLSIGNPALVMTNLVSLVVGAITVATVVRFRPRLAPDATRAAVGPAARRDGGVDTSLGDAIGTVIGVEVDPDRAATVALGRVAAHASRV